MCAPGFPTVLSGSRLAAPGAAGAEAGAMEWDARSQGDIAVQAVISEDLDRHLLVWCYDLAGRILRLSLVIL